MEHLIYSIEDDNSIARLIQVTLTKQGYKVEVFSDGKTFFEALKNQKPDLMLIDLMLPDIPGVEIIKKVRNNPVYDDVDIMVISANKMVIDKVESLDIGADDYMEKPFDVLELMGRVNAHLRRKKHNDILTVGDITLNVYKRTCHKGEVEIPLTTREFDILSLLCLSGGKTVTRETILRKIWEVPSDEVTTRTIDMHIKSLRKKLGDDSQKIITTVYGLGYRLNA